MRKQQARNCSNGHDADWEGKLGLRVTEVERRGLLPRFIQHRTYKKNDILLFSSLS